MKPLSLLILFFALTSFSLKKDTRKVLLLIFAHPDDELAIAPVIARLSHTYRIYTVYATDGKGGTRVKNIAPDELGKIRQAEVACSLQKLGAEPPIFLHVDRLDSKNSLRVFWNETKWAKDSLKRIITNLSPKAIITMGPDGDTGHPEHRVISGLTTELILRESWYDRYPLYYITWTKEQADRFAQFGIDELMYADKRYVNLTVHYTNEDEARSWEATKCHDSQYTQKEIEEMISGDKADTVNQMHFRKFIVDQKKRTSF